MLQTTENLRRILERFHIGNSELAKALGVDPSLVSRWLKGERKLKASSVTVESLAEYLLKSCKSIEDIRWLQENFEQAALPADMTSVGRARQNLILWLASDGEELRRNIGTPSLLQRVRTPAAAPTGDLPGNKGTDGSFMIVMELNALLKDMPEGGNVDVFLSSDEVDIATSEGMSRLVKQAVENYKCSIRLLVRISGNTQAVSRLIDTYMQLLVSANMQLFTVHGMTQTVANQMQIILPGRGAMLITEIPKAASPPVGIAVRDEHFTRELEDSFERILRYAQSSLNVYNDNYSRNILELLYMEFAMPGNLDVVKDSINPLYMTCTAYDRVLRAQGQDTEEFAWRSAEFHRFKEGMDRVLAGGTIFREILPMSRLNHIAENGYCRMPGLYFMKLGCVNLDAQGCADILEGYIGYLEHVPAFQMVILEDIAPLHEDSCWHIKQHQSVAINTWNGEEPVMIHSDQPWLVREFQAHYEHLWMQQGNAASSRGHVAGILRDALARLRARHLEP